MRIEVSANEYQTIPSSFLGLNADVARTRTNQHRTSTLLDCMSDPPSATTGRKYRERRIARQTKGIAPGHQREIEIRLDTPDLSCKGLQFDECLRQIECA